MTTGVVVDADIEVRILIKIKELFGAERIQGYVPPSVKVSRCIVKNLGTTYYSISQRGSATHSLANLTRDISTNWGKISDNLKELIRANFYVFEDGSTVRISLF